MLADDAEVISLIIPQSLEIDADADSVISCADCDDSEATVFPGNPEICDGLDNDCNTFVDDGSGATLAKREVSS